MLLIDMKTEIEAPSISLQPEASFEMVSWISWSGSGLRRAPLSVMFQPSAYIVSLG